MKDETPKSLRIAISRRTPTQLAVDSRATIYDHAGAKVCDALSATIVVDDDGISTMTVVRFARDANGKRVRGETVTEEYSLSMLMVEGWLNRPHAAEAQD